MEEDPAELVGRAFVEHYYNLFDNDRSCLSALYHPTSMLTFEGSKVVRVEEIAVKLKELPFDKCQRLISTVDSQPSSNTGIVVFVSGSLRLPGEEHHLRFSQMFHLIPSPAGSFFVQNDIFRLNYG